MSMDIRKMWETEREATIKRLSGEQVTESKREASVQ